MYKMDGIKDEIRFYSDRRGFWRITWVEIGYQILIIDLFDILVTNIVATPYYADPLIGDSLRLLGPRHRKGGLLGSDLMPLT